MSYFNMGIPDPGLDSFFGRQKRTKRSSVYVVSFQKDGILDQRVLRNRTFAVNFARTMRQQGYEVEIERG